MPDTKTSALPNPLTIATLATNDKVVVYDLSADSLTTAQVDAIAARQVYPLWDGTNWEFNQSTAPTARPGGGALGVGDTWIERNATTQAIVGQWEWNGTYWLSTVTHSSGMGVINTISASTQAVIPIEISTHNIFIVSYFVNSAGQSTPFDASNHWNVRLGSNITIYATITTVGRNATGFSAIASVNTHVDIAATGTNYFENSFTPTGSPGFLRRTSAGILYRYARK